MLKIERQCFSKPWTKKMLLEELSNSAFVALGYFSEGALSGFVGFWIIIDEAHIANVAVLPALRRRGIGKALVAALVEYAKNLNCTGLTLEVRRTNTAAVSLYEQTGFKTEGVRPLYYENSTDALIMWKRDI
jgi:ribosomal-protein-alanine N-acetyltransferase